MLEGFLVCQLPTPIFSAVGEALEWLLYQHGVWVVIHYVDNILFQGAWPYLNTSKHSPPHW